jgi:hypothetical protein
MNHLATLICNVANLFWEYFEKFEEEFDEDRKNAERNSLLIPTQEKTGRGIVRVSVTGFEEILTIWEKSILNLTLKGQFYVTSGRTFNIGKKYPWFN